MNAQTKMSAKGQVVIPKAVRDRLRWKEGASLEVVETGSGVLLRPSGAKRERLSIEEFRRRHPPQPGPRLTLEQMDEAVLQEAARRYADRTRRSE
jgi:AbrB family looped-hinge helix DNA binding protein